MSKSSSTTVAAVLAAAFSVVWMSLGASVASASPASMSTPMPLSGQLRACDFTALKWQPNPGYARPVAHVGTDGAGNVVATVDIDTGQPNTLYDIRVVQTPRPSSGCAAGAPGVITGGVQTDDAGVGHATVQGPAAKGATGAWVAVELPSGLSQTPAEFYTTEFIASI
jgi:hypothetical protein